MVNTIAKKTAKNNVGLLGNALMVVAQMEVVLTLPKRTAYPLACPLIPVEIPVLIRMMENVGKTARIVPGAGQMEVIIMIKMLPVDVNL